MIASALLLLTSGARRRRLRDGEVSLVYYVLEPRRWGRWRRRGVGPAEPWLMLHGLGSVAASWGRVLYALRRDCRLVVPELSALGGTRAPGGWLGLELGARLLARLIEEELGGGPVTLAGLSMGAWMAMRLAQTRPELIARLVLIDAAGYRNQDWDRIGKLVRVQDLDGVDRLYGAMFRKAPWVMRRSRRTFLQAYTSPPVRHLLASLGEPDTYRDRDLKLLTMPVALIWGEHDGLFGLDAARAMAAALPRSRLYVLRDCGHAVHLECPRDLASALQRLRRELPVAAAPDAGEAGGAGAPRPAAADPAPHPSAETG
ncbi:MAG TPA: alpha/beta hydrolase [Thermoanaerobaculia bacterium]|nr:alpha/beta hydrolase [Thermoanaerobaculia bacterium]